MSAKPLFVVRFNGRDDNLGDLFIVRCLADSLSLRGEVVLYGRPCVALPKIQRLSTKAALASRLFRSLVARQPVVHLAPPGARLGGGPSRRRGLFVRRLNRVTLGVSVAPDSDLSWCRNYRWIGVRDMASCQAIKNAGFSSVEYFPDLAFLAPGGGRSGVERTRICVSFREALPGAEMGDAKIDDLAESLRGVLPHLVADDGRSVLSFHQVAEDAGFSGKIALSLGVALREHTVSLKDYAEFYDSAKVVVSNRLHCLLMGATRGAVPIALTTRGHSKLVAIYEALGWQHLLLFIDDAADAIRRCAEISNHLDEVQANVLQTVSKQRDLANQLLDQRLSP